MGLNETYIVFRGSILMMNPLPIIAHAFSLLIQEEIQREIKPHNHLALESSALNVSTNRIASFQTNYSTNNSQSYRNRPFCDYYKRPGHTREKCYTLHGYPQGSNQNQNPNLSHNQASSFNQNPRQNYNYGDNSGVNQSIGFNMGNRGMANAYVAATDTQHTSDENCSAQNVNLTKEEYSQLVNLLQQFQSGGGRDSLDNVNTSSANFADSGASNNMTFNRSLLTNIVTLPYPLLVTLTNGYKVKVTEIGNVVLTPKITLNRAPSMKRPLVIGRVKDGLYILCPRCLKNNSTSPEVNVIDFLSTPVTHCTCNTQCLLHSIVNTSSHVNKCVLSSSVVNNPSAGNEKQFLSESLSSNCPSHFSHLLPSTSINDQIPYELLYKRKPKYSHLKSFGCLCYPTVPKPHRDKFEPRTPPHIFVGYPFNTKGYKVLSLATRKITVSRDVVFNESIFPFATNLDISP
ncbi:uncharacterized protein [Nicotiana sylvestris]|uniref:uncharacterized protein n=1 Tax=Nicotiana sylvestris TaxID=4096 RepID=UPI00388C92D8